jgi:hypothetical protein
VRAPILLITPFLFPTSDAGACTVNGAAVPCEYPPIEQSVACLPAFGILPAPPAAAVDTRLHRVTMSAPNTTCNDGSPGVFYVRRSLGPFGWNKWLIVIDGGGAGFSASGTLDSGMWGRWSGSTGDLLDCVSNGSNDWLDAAGLPGRDGAVDLPEEAVFRGILDVRSSAFAFYNLVFINYCSSDSWSGQAGTVELHDAGPWTSGGDVYRGFKMDFNGHDMIQNLLDQLRDPGSWTPDVQAWHMNDLDDAELVVVAGESAGGSGVMHNLDWISAELDWTEVLGSIGASHKPPIGVAGDAWFLDGLGPVNGVSDLEEGAVNMYAQRQLIDGFLDESCVTALGIDAWQCQMLSSTEPHLETLHFIKQDMSDPIVSDLWANVADYQAGIKQDYNAWRSSGAPPFFAPNCTHHESLNGGAYYSHKLQLFEAPLNQPLGAMLDELDYDEALHRFVDSGGTGTTFAYDGLIGFRLVPRPPPLPPTLVRVQWVSDCP